MNDTNDTNDGDAGDASHPVSVERSRFETRKTYRFSAQNADENTREKPTFRFTTEHLDSKNLYRLAAQKRDALVREFTNAPEAFVTRWVKRITTENDRRTGHTTFAPFVSAREAVEFLPELFELAYARAMIPPWHKLTSRSTDAWQHLTGIGPTSDGGIALARAAAALENLDHRRDLSTTPVAQERHDGPIPYVAPTEFAAVFHEELRLWSLEQSRTRSIAAPDATKLKEAHRPTERTHDATSRPVVSDARQRRNHYGREP